MTCWSCRFFTVLRCLRSLRAWPNGTPTDCAGFEYEPGADEREDA